MENEHKQIEYTPEIIKELKEIVLHTENNIMFMHCNHCLKDMPEGVTPKEWGQYEVAVNRLRLANGGIIDIASLWCRRCGRPLWDTRHLKKVY